MRWSLARMFFLVTAVAIGLAVYSRYWRWNVLYQPYIALSGYLALLATATMVGLISSPSIRKRFLLSYSLFGWIYLLVVLRAGFALTTYGDNLSLQMIGLGISLGFLCAFATLAFTDPVQTKKDDDSETPKSSS